MQGRSNLLSRARLALGAAVPLGELTRVLAAAFGARPAVRAEGRLRTYRELDDEVAGLAAAQAVHALEGRTVGVVCANRIELALHVFALARIGAVPLPLNHRLKREELAAALQAAGATAAIADPGLADGGLVPSRIDAAVLGAWREGHPEARIDAAAPASLDDTALLLATSGTTGRPKIARLSSRALLGGVGRLHALPVGLQRGPRAGRDVVLSALPLAHVMGFSTLLGALCSGTLLVHLERFDAREVLGAIEEHHANVFVGVPTMYLDLEAAGAASRDLSTVQLWISAADAMPEDRARRFQAFGALDRITGRKLLTAAFADVYGMVELGGAAAVRLYPPAPRGRLLPALAVLLPGFDARAVGADGRRLFFGQAGELQLRGRGLFQGYVGQGAAPGGGWFPTGDFVRLWPLGVFQFAGRAAERLKVGGFSVFPAEVEEALRAHPDVADVVLVGVPDERLGDKPVALVVPRSHGFDADAFLTWARERVAGYRRPHEAIAVEALPRGGNGKLDRAAARRLALAAR